MNWAFFYNDKMQLLLNESFFNHPYEVVFRSFSDSNESGPIRAIKWIGQDHS